MSKTSKPRKPKFSPSFVIFDETARRFTAASSFAALRQQIEKGYTPTLRARDARRLATEQARGAGATEQDAAAQGFAAQAAVQAMASTLIALGLSYIDDDGNCVR